MRNVSYKKSQRGIGLLELMLTMVIIAIVTMMSVQYFGASKRNTVTSKAVNEIQAIISTVAGMPSPQSATNLTDAVAMSGQIPAEYVYTKGDTTPLGDGEYIITTPWTSSALPAQFAASVSGDTLTITSNDLPNWGCESLVDKFQASADFTNCGTGDSDNHKQLELQFPLTMSGDL